MKTKIITVSAISSALTAIPLIVGAYFEFADLFALVISSVFVILPLYFNSYKGSILCFVSGGLISLICTGFNFMSIVFPAYFSFFGIYPIAKSKLIKKNIDKHVRFILGLIWAVVVAYGCYFYYTLIMQGVLDGIPESFTNLIVYGVGLFSVIFFVIYDRFLVVVSILINKYLRKIIK